MYKYNNKFLSYFQSISKKVSASTTAISAMISFWKHYKKNLQSFPGKLKSRVNKDDANTRD